MQIHATHRCVHWIGWSVNPWPPAIDLLRSRFWRSYPCMHDLSAIEWPSHKCLDKGFSIKFYPELSLCPTSQCLIAIYTPIVSFWITSPASLSPQVSDAHAPGKAANPEMQCKPTPPCLQRLVAQRCLMGACMCRLRKRERERETLTITQSFTSDI